MQNLIKSHRDLIVWNKATELCVYVYKMTEKFPKNETFGLISQMRRSAVSIPSNIAEGRQRGTRKDFSQFIRIALGSGAELETQTEISLRIEYINKDESEKIFHSISEIRMMLHAILNKLSA